MEKEWNWKIFGTKKRSSRSLPKPRKAKKMFYIGKLCAYQDDADVLDDDQT